MSATITWVIEYMQCKPTDGSYTDVVITAGWRCNGVQIVGSGELAPNFYATNYGSSSFPMPEGSFTPYASLTQEQVLGWCWSNGVNQIDVEAGVQSNIDNQINPTVVTPALPWSA